MKEIIVIKYKRLAEEPGVAREKKISESPHKISAQSVQPFVQVYTAYECLVLLYRYHKYGC